MAQRLSDVMSQQDDILPVEGKKSMRLGDVMSMNPVQYSDEEEKDLFSSGVISTPTDSDREYFRSLGKIGAFESFARNAKPSTFIPVIGTISEGVRNAHIVSSINRLQANNYKDDDIVQRNKDAQFIADEIRRRVEEQERGYSWGGQVTNVVKELPAIMAEFMATGPLAVSGRMAARKGAEAVLNRATQNAITRIVTKKVAGTVGSIATRTAALGVAKIPAGMATRESQERIGLTDKGVKILESGKTKPFTSLIKSTADVAFEIASEQSGGTIRKIAGAVAAPAVRAVSPYAQRLANNRMVGAISMLMTKLKNNGLAKEVSDKVKFDGILEEYGEERWGNFLRAVANVDDFGSGENANVMDRVIASIPSMEESLVELGAFSIPAVGFAGASFMNRVQQDNAKGVDEKLVDGVVNEILVDRGLKEPAPTPTTPEIVEPGANVSEVAPTETEKTRPEDFATAEEYVASKINEPIFVHSTDAEAFNKFNTTEVWFEQDSMQGYGERDVGIRYAIKKPFVTTQDPDRQAEYGVSPEEARKNKELYESLGGESNPATFEKLRELGYDTVVDGEGFAALYPEKIQIVSQNVPTKNGAMDVEKILTAEWEAAQKATAPKMVEKEFVEEYEEAPASLEEEYKRAHKERTEQTKTLADKPAKYKRKRGNEMSDTLRRYKGDPSKEAIKDELKKLKTISVGKTVDTPDGIGVVTKNPAYGKVQVEVNGKRKVYIMEDVAPPKPTKEDAIASLKAKSEKEMRKYLKDIGREYTPTAIKRTRVVKKMVPVEKAEKKPVDTEEPAPLPVERSDEQIRAGLLADYLGGTEAKGGLIFAEDGPSRVTGAYSNERPKWWKELSKEANISMDRTTEVLRKYSKGEKLTETEQRDLNAIMESGGKSMSESMISKDDVDFLRRKEKAIQSGATEDEAIEIASSAMEEDALDIAGIVDDEAWVEGVPAEPSPVLETPAKEPKVAKATSDVVTQMVEEGFNQLSEVEQAKYSPIEKKAKLEAVVDLANDYERTKRVAFGKEPAGMADAQIVYNYVKNRAIAEGDMDTLIQLAESPVSKARSEIAQALGAAGYDNGLRESDPVSAMVEISKTREKETKKSVGESKISAEKKVGVEGIRKYTSKELKAMDWNAFIKELEC